MRLVKLLTNVGLYVNGKLESEASVTRDHLSSPQKRSGVCLFGSMCVCSSDSLSVGKMTLRGDVSRPILNLADEKIEEDEDNKNLALSRYLEDIACLLKRISKTSKGQKELTSSRWTALLLSILEVSSGVTTRSVTSTLRAILPSRRGAGAVAVPLHEGDTVKKHAVGSPVRAVKVARGR